MDDNKIQEGEILTSTATINSLIQQIDQLKLDIGKHKDLLDSIFANDPTYQLHEQAVKEAVKVKSQTKKQILKLPQAQDLTGKLADKKAFLKQLQSDLSGYLQDYSRATGFTTFESDSGSLMEIVVDYKIKKISK